MQSEQDRLDQLRRLEPTEYWQADLVAHGGEVVSAGPFRALLGPSQGALGLDYAAPVEPLGTDDEVVAGLRELRRIFAHRQRPLRIEFNDPLFPALARLLEQHAFTLQEREPLMICTPPDFRPVTNLEVAVRFLQSTDPEQDLAAFQSIFSEVLLERPWQPRPEALARFRAEAERGGNRSHALAELNGRPVGTGFISSLDSVAEITRVATLPAYRRRGVAATLTSFIMLDRFDRGDSLVWLTAADEIAQALYQKLGFRLVGARLYYAAG